ncbi:hypothetical protein GCM10010238_01730 [Streptomyces griseoviridis]|uniref:Uncharacterized protein n=1 Tax=Streptomyces griseoviridis TaxID=45398 RepID=A0A918G497_STRGD|nr:hypothetical protein GCM10010238_01730 [Streptomyces niveoruber]
MNARAVAGGPVAGRWPGRAAGAGRVLDRPGPVKTVNAVADALAGPGAGPVRGELSAGSA